MRIKGPAAPELPALAEPLAETAEEQAFFEGGFTYSKTAPAQPIKTTSVLSKNSLLSVQTEALSPLRFDSARFRRVMDDATASTVSQGNTVLPLFDGVQSFAERDRLIDGAKQSIMFQTFIFNSDETGWALAKRLATKAKDGVKVCVIYDSLGTGRADPAMFKMMREAGVDVREYAPPQDVTKLNNRWHQKLLIVDGEAAITGGMNIANEYAYGGTDKKVTSRSKHPEEPWRDVDVRVRGPMLRTILLDFLSNWERVGAAMSEADEDALLAQISREPLPGGVETRYFTRKPIDGRTDTGTEAYYYAISAAKQSITIENAYFLPTDDIRQALMDAAKRGVTVRILTNSRESNDMGFVSDIIRYRMEELVAAGVEIYEKQGGTVHAKTATFDGEYSFIGSLNLNQRSAFLDTEDIVAIKDRQTAAALAQRFDGSAPEFHRVTLDELQRQGPLVNARQWMMKTLLGSFS